MYELYDLYALHQNIKLIKLIKFIKFIIIIIISTIIISTIALIYNQEALIYPGINSTKKVLTEPFIDIKGSYFKKGTSDILTVFLGGNNSTPTDFENHAKISKDNVLIIVYPGFNKTSGKINKKSITQYINFVLAKVCKKHQCYNINFICYSIGCAICLHYLSETDNKSKNKVLKCTLLAPFWSLDRVVSDIYCFPKEVVRVFLNHNWENFKTIQKIDDNIEIEIFHGKNDKLINITHSEQLSKMRKCKFNITDDDHYTILRHI